MNDLSFGEIVTLKSTGESVEVWDILQDAESDLTVVVVRCESREEDDEFVFMNVFPNMLTA